VNPDAAVTTRLGKTRRHQGPSLSIAGAMPNGANAQWKTAYPDGEGIYVQALRNTEQRALLRGEAQVLPFPDERRALPSAKAA
jgi:hypothetical protein